MLSFHNLCTLAEEGRVTVPSRYECTVASQQGLECMPIPEANGSADIMYEEIDKLQGFVKPLIQKTWPVVMILQAFSS